ncbi:DDB1- and CUL4-associated factor 8-like [Penaeus japonicus]|uniref:DDB1- and CUL4-associated factor 8-like n=1 Tax=Penaeus japonicus TaxID=27405 RepID=UPI001C70F99C|nr:DDB1- and CUL4-associated factor 8-like [Penaeus japonicus]XP_042858396.1 DDB1- and CUL4-associated factor 8-like [Penaeus japonicus]XP_042858397.1 DDB1- and CUL4-associated factor 8-like [Penaeus japonicus]XP_042858398.1 DDB1- and CUL4-associated factor 8-like [Penaeus japonicus]XP_042858400.1 DDB1- and CUL4-associated factor 8-like [Penaeus japonicus]XP_042858401.1 DDB1- and CUL4-associated factor 8-like [Penaeus japonicus]
MAEASDSSHELEVETSTPKDSDSSLLNNSNKRDRNVKKDDSGISSERLENSDDEGNKKLKSEGEKKSGESSGTSFGKGKTSRQRSYRPRLLESSSNDSDDDDDDDDSTLRASNNEDKKSDTALTRRNNLTITSASEMEDTSADTSRDTETDHMEPTSPSAMETGSAASGNTEDDNTDDSPPLERRIERRFSSQRIFGGLLSDTDSDSDDGGRRMGLQDGIENETQWKDTEEAIAKEMTRIKERPKPKHHWNFVDQVVQRQLGSRARYQSSVLFSHHYYDSLHVPKRLELMYKMEFHRGCVNALSFNASGTRLASGSDDFQIAIWDWAREKAIITFYSGHRNNVFQSKFLPLSGDTHIVSCARDGQVRLAELSSTGVCKATRKLAKHHGPAHKLATLPTSPHVVLSAGEDAVVLNIDIRQEQPSRVAFVKDISGSRVSLYSIHAHPINENQFCVSGHDQYVRIYDRRCGNLDFPVLKFCPRHLYEAVPTPTVTCAVYSGNGDSILASYNDDDIYLFDTSRSEAADAVHRYSGHRNSATVKGVNFFGPGSQYIVSGSDCGNIFFWHRETEAIVQCMPGDENGVVNVLEPHPHIPVLATSGLDDDVKIWVPTCEEDPDLPNLEQTLKSNLSKRHKERNEEFTGLDSQMLMVLWHHIRRTDRRRRRMATAGNSSNGVGAEAGNGTGGSSSDDSNDSEEDDSEEHRGIQCATH